ncbi:MAG: hypothetical protein KF691_10770 [Phycisphaeraceae bacterium]|nr:hypothetical protein [Phycisphaeraceae bacterium]
MDRDFVSRLWMTAEAGAVSLPDLVGLWLQAGIARVRVDLVRMETLYFDLEDKSASRFNGLLRGVSTRKTPSLSGALQALERSRLDRISYSDFVVRIARSGYASFAIFTGQNIISFEGSGGEHLSVPIHLLPERAKCG